MPDDNLIGGSTGDEKKDDIIMQKEAKHGKYNHAILPTFGDVFEPTLKRPICRKFKKDWSGEVIDVHCRFLVPDNTQKILTEI